VSHRLLSEFRHHLDSLGMGADWSDGQLSHALHLAEKTDKQRDDVLQARGLSFVPEATWQRVWHDEDVLSNKYESYGIIVGPGKIADREGRPEVSDVHSVSASMPGALPAGAGPGGGGCGGGPEDQVDKGLIFDSVQAAGKWLAQQWGKLESRYGRKQALAMAAAMLATSPLPGNIPAIVAVAEGIRGLSGYFGKECGGVVPTVAKAGPRNCLPRKFDPEIKEQDR